MEEESIFVACALEADPDAAPLVGRTESWVPAIDAQRLLERSVRVALQKAGARRAVSNVRLDSTCSEFIADLRHEERGVADSRRVRAFVATGAQQFVRQALPAQATAVRAWLVSKDPALDKHRAALDLWSDSALKAVQATKDVGPLRGESWTGREELADKLTRERDALHESLAAIAREKSLPRDWPDAFFRVEERGAAPAEQAGPEPTP